MRAVTSHRALPVRLTQTSARRTPPMPPRAPRVRCTAAPDDGADPWRQAAARRDVAWGKHMESRYPSRQTPPGAPLRQALPPLASGPLGSPARASGTLARILLDPGFQRDTLFAPFTNPAPERPSREKVFHANGSLVPADLQVRADSPYTGLLATGAPCLARLSAGGGSDLVPGLGLLLFPASGPPLGLVAIPGLDGEAIAPGRRGPDFFAPTLTTHTAPARHFPGKLLDRTLALVSWPRGLDARHMGVAELAAVDGAGTAVAAPRAPGALLLRSSLGGRTADEADFRDALMDCIQAGTQLYTVEDEQGRVFAELVAQGECSASTYADRVFAVPHYPVR